MKHCVIHLQYHHIIIDHPTLLRYNFIHTMHQLMNIIDYYCFYSHCYNNNYYHSCYNNYYYHFYCYYYYYCHYYYYYYYYYYFTAINYSSLLFYCSQAMSFIQWHIAKKVEWKHLLVKIWSLIPVLMILYLQNGWSMIRNQHYYR